MSKELEEKIISIINGDINKNVIETLSIEERIFLIENYFDNFLCRNIINLFIDNKIVLLDYDNSVELLNRNLENDIFPIEFCPELLTLMTLTDEIVFDIFTRIDEEDVLKYVKNKETLKKYIENSNLPVFRKINLILFLPDDMKIDFIKDRKYRHEVYRIVISLKDIELQKKYLSYVTPYERAYVISKIKDEKFKVDQIKLLTKDKGEIIASLSSDAEKQYLLFKYKLVLTSHDISVILSSFKDEKYIRNNVHLINTDEIRYNLFTTKKVPKDIRDNCLINIKSEEYLFYCLGHFDLFDRELLSKIDRKVILKFLKSRREVIENISTDFLYYIEDFSFLEEVLPHTQFSEEYNDDLKFLFQKVAIIYRLNLNHLIEIAKITGCRILNSLESKNIQAIINLEDDYFRKFLLIIDKENLKFDISVHTSVLTSFLQRQFRVKNPDMINVFINTIHNIEDNNIKEAIVIIKEVASIIDLKKYNMSLDYLIMGLINKNENIIRIYNEMTNEYIKLKRNEYVNNNMEDALKKSAELEYDKNDLVRYIVKTLSIEQIIRELNEWEYEDEKQRELIGNEELIRKILNFKKNPKSFSEIPNEIKDNIKTLNEMIVYAYSNSYKCPSINGVKYHCTYENDPVTQLVSIIQEIDPKILMEILMDGEILEDLLSYLKKYKLLGWGKRFEAIEPDCDIATDSYIIAAIINCYSTMRKIRNEKMKKGEKISLTTELDIASCFESSANIYTILLGEEDFSFIRRNPKPNSSPSNKFERINKAMSYLKPMHERKFISVPTIDKSITLSNGKTLGIILGNTSDPINLTYGERTGTCMRIGGAGGSLFEFCLLNTNGFHISFNEGDKLISRVSGFRNGNTVFLNQLRYSLDSKYSNADLIEACKQVAKMLIELTKDSEFPIQNVVISPSYCFTGHKTKDLRVDVKSGMPKFYSDVGSKAVVLASSDESGLAPVKLGPDSHELYPVLRGKVKKEIGIKASTAAKRIEALDKIYSGMLPEDIDIREIDCALCYYGEDWYVGLDSNHNIITYIMENSNNKEIAKLEVEKYKNMIEIYLKSNSLEFEEVKKK